MRISLCVVAIDAAYDEITHINMVLLNLPGAENLDMCTPIRFKVPGEKAGDPDLVKSKGIAADPPADMANPYRVGQVVKGRRLYFAPDLLEAQGFVPFSD